MVSKYDVFYIIAKKGEIKVKSILEELNKDNSEYNLIFNHVLELEKNKLIKRSKTIEIIHKKRSIDLFNLISFCIENGMDYNPFFRKKMLNLLENASKIEFFSGKDININHQTLNSYVKLLEKNGLLLIISQKPLKCKLLRNQFIFDLLKFHNKKVNFYDAKKKNLLKPIKREIKKYKQVSRNPILLKKYESIEEINFIHSSLNLEGNPVTLPETQNLIFKKIVPEGRSFDKIEEVRNYKKSVDFMLKLSSRKQKLNVDLILKYHNLAMNHIEDSGVFRKCNVIIKKNPLFKTSDWKEINSKINKLMKKYKDFEFKKINLERLFNFVAYFHNEFQRIHPFIDGNSRTTRLLMIHILRYHKIPVLDIPIGFFDIYLDLTKRSKKRDDDSLSYFIQELVLMNLKKINKGDI